METKSIANLTAAQKRLLGYVVDSRYEVHVSFRGDSKIDIWDSEDGHFAKRAAAQTASGLITLGLAEWVQVPRLAGGYRLEAVAV